MADCDGLQNRRCVSTRGFESPFLRQLCDYTFAIISRRGRFQYGDLHLGQTRGSVLLFLRGTHSCSHRVQR